MMSSVNVFFPANFFLRVYNLHDYSPRLIYIMYIHVSV